MAEISTYTIVIQGKRIEVSSEVYYAYHQAREAERYQRKVICQSEMSLERFQDEGVSVEYQFARSQLGIEEALIQAEELKQLYQALDMLKPEDQQVIEHLYFMGKSERVLAAEWGIPPMTLHHRKHRILKKLKKIMDI